MARTKIRFRFFHLPYTIYRTIDAYGFLIIIKSMNDDFNTTKSSDQNVTPSPSITPTPSSAPEWTPPKKDNNMMSKGVIAALVAIVALAGGLAAGYYWSNMTKNKDIESAKTTAKEETLKTAAADLEKAKTEAKQKTATATTCNADELSLTTSPSSEGTGAGTVAYNLILTNISKRTCVLGGFPGVSLVNVNGNQVGNPADRAANYTEKELSLAPNTKVKAIVSVSNSSNFSDGQCKAGATKFRVYPPNDVGYLSVASPVDSWCPGFTVSPVLAQ